MVTLVFLMRDRLRDLLRDRLPDRRRDRLRDPRRDRLWDRRRVRLWDRRRDRLCGGGGGRSFAYIKLTVARGRVSDAS